MVRASWRLVNGALLLMPQEALVSIMIFETYFIRRDGIF
jgi:hypothetical protein